MKGDVNSHRPGKLAYRIFAHLPVVNYEVYIDGEMVTAENEVEIRKVYNE